MKRFSISLLAKLLAVLLLIIVIRVLAEVLRLDYLHGDTLTFAQIRPFILSAFAATLSLAAALLAIWAARPSIAVALACITVAGLFVYRVHFFPPESGQPSPATTAVNPLA
jgi:hypothetical protein